MSDSERLLGAWLSFVSETMRGTQNAYAAWQQLLQNAESRDALTAWMSQMAPGTVPPADLADSASPEAVRDWVAAWQKAMGVVPRKQYLELLEENDRLRRRVKELEKKMARLEETAGPAAPGPEQLTESWSRFMTDAMKTQAEWLERWGAGERTDDAEKDSGTDEEA